MSKEKYPRYWDEEMETMPREATLKLQEEKLPQAIKRAYATPFYKKRFKAIGANPSDIRTIDDLEKLPFTTKEDLRKSQQENPPFGDYCVVPMEKIAHIFASSGTTGEPTSMLVSDGGKRILAYRTTRGFWSGGLRPYDIAQNTYSYQLAPGAWMVQWAMCGTGATVISMGVGNSVRQLQTMKRYGTTCLTGTPSYALYLLEVAENEGIDPEKDLRIRLLFLGGEPGASIPSVRKKIESAWGGAKVIDTLGQGETMAWACACEEQNGLHIAEDHFIVEVVDPETKKRVGPGEIGIAVVTHLEEEAQSLIRWWTDDETYYVEDSCACGRTGRLLPHGFIGRKDDMLKISGTRIWPATIEEVLRDIPTVGQEFQIILDDTNVLETGMLRKLKLRVECREDTEDREKVAEQIITQIKSRVNVTPEVDIVDPGTLPRFEMKAKRTIDMRKNRE